MVAFVPPSGNEKPLGPWTNYMKKTNNNKNNETKKKILAKTALLISLLVNHDHQRQQSFIPLYMPYICAT